MNKGDFHIHSIYSGDSFLRVRFILKTMKKMGFTHIAITDHNSVKGGIEGKKLSKKFDIEVFVGQEIKTPQGEIIVLGADKNLRGNIFDIIDKARDENFITIVPHPFDPIRRNSIFSKSGFEKSIEILKKVDGIECLNSRCIFDIFNKKARYISELLKKPCVSGSDSHTSSELGKSYTVFEGDLKTALRKRKTFVKGKTNFVSNHFKSLFHKYSKRLFGDHFRE